MTQEYKADLRGLSVSMSINEADMTYQIDVENRGSGPTVIESPFHPHEKFRTFAPRTIELWAIDRYGSLTEDLRIGSEGYRPAENPSEWIASTDTHLTVDVGATASNIYSLRDLIGALLYANRFHRPYSLKAGNQQLLTQLRSEMFRYKIRCMVALPETNEHIKVESEWLNLGS